MAVLSYDRNPLSARNVKITVRPDLANGLTDLLCLTFPLPHSLHAGVCTFVMALTRLLAFQRV